MVNADPETPRRLIQAVTFESHFRRRPPRAWRIASIGHVRIPDRALLQVTADIPGRQNTGG